MKYFYKIFFYFTLLLYSYTTFANSFEENEDVFEAQFRAQMSISSEYKSLLLKFIISENQASLNYTACGYLNELQRFQIYQTQNIDHQIYAYGNTVIFEDDLEILEQLIAKYKITCETKH